MNIIDEQTARFYLPKGNVFSHLFLEMGDHLVKHGDGVKDIAFTVENCDLLVQVILQA